MQIDADRPAVESVAPMTQPSRLRFGAALFAIACCACTGPGLRVVNPAGDTAFVDGAGIGTADTTLPFRYYGTTRWDALPADTPGGRADWNRSPGSAQVTLPAPAPHWLFPLDLPLELLRRVFVGRADVTTTIELAPLPATLAVHDEVAPAGLSETSRRARAARTTR
jgi:hypothetical protein